MAEYLELEKVLDDRNIITVQTKEYGSIDVIPVDTITDVPLADVQPMKHGEWKFYKNNGIYDTYKCSICKESFELPMDADISKAMRYCPNCGARMIKDGDAE